MKGGKVAYTGEMGQNSEKVLNYFSRLSKTALPQQGTNPSDYVIAAVSEVNPLDAQSFFKESEEYVKVQEDQSKDNNQSETEKTEAIATMKKATEDLNKRKSFFRELHILTRRQILTQWRNPNYALTRMVCSFFLAIYFGVLFIADKRSIEGAVLTSKLYSIVECTLQPG